MCRQEFTSRTEFMIHLRNHFVDNKGIIGVDISAADLLAKTLIDNSGLCT